LSPCNKAVSEGQWGLCGVLVVCGGRAQVGTMVMNKGMAEWGMVCVKVGNVVECRW